MQVYEKEKKKNKVAVAVMFTALILMSGIGVVAVSAFIVDGYAVVNVVAVTHNSITALSIAGPIALDTSTIDVSNTTSQMTTLFVTLIAVMIPLIIIMAYLGIFQDFIGGIGRAFGGMFKRQ